MFYKNMESKFGVATVGDAVHATDLGYAGPVGSCRTMLNL
jgi:hypothetical protein